MQFADDGRRASRRCRFLSSQIKRSVLDESCAPAPAKPGGNGESDRRRSQAAAAPRSRRTVTLDVKVKRTETMVKNVIGYLEGNGPLERRNVVVGAHYDHLGYGGFGSLARKAAKGKIHHGADDNGSGSTSVMELARRFAAMKNREGRRIVFMTFTAEERGLIGSRHYCTDRAALPLERHRRDVQSRHGRPAQGRSPRRGPSRNCSCSAWTPAKASSDLVKKHNPGFDVVKDNSVFGASDHYSFYLQKIPVIFFLTGTHPDYHRPTDTPDKINVAGMKRIADYAERIIEYWRTDPKRPEFVAMKNTFSGGGPKGPKMGILPDYDLRGQRGSRSTAFPPGGPAELARHEERGRHRRNRRQSDSQRQRLHVDPRQQKAGVGPRRQNPARQQGDAVSR